MSRIWSIYDEILPLVEHTNQNQSISDFRVDRVTNFPRIIDEGLWSSNSPSSADHWPASDLGGSSPSYACRQQPKRFAGRNAALVLRTIDFDWQYNRIILHCRSTRRTHSIEQKWNQQLRNYFENKKIIFIRFDHLVKLTNVLMA